MCVVVRTVCCHPYSCRYFTKFHRATFSLDPPPKLRHISKTVTLSAVQLVSTLATSIKPSNSGGATDGRYRRNGATSNEQRATNVWMFDCGDGVAVTVLWCCSPLNLRSRQPEQNPHSFIPKHIIPHEKVLPPVCTYRYLVLKVLCITV